MERRLVLTGLAALAASPALAQSKPPPPVDAPAAAPQSGDAPAAIPAMKIDTPISMSAVAEKHVKETMVVGSMSLAVSRLALPKVKHPALKQFVGFEIAEQETIADILKRMKMPGGPPMGTSKAPTDAELTANLDARGKSAVEKFHAMKAGPEFDRDYVKAQIDAHRELLAIQDTYLSKPDTIDQTNIAKLASGMIKEHLVLLGDLEKTG